MGKTLKAIQHEIQHVWNGIYQELSTEERQLPKPAKLELRKYLHDMSSNRIHSFSPIFIKRKIRELQLQYGTGGETMSKDLNEWVDEVGHDFEI